MAQSSDVENESELGKKIFGQCAADYARYRFSYPAELFQCLAGLTKSAGVAWDCATGNGQAAVGLAQFFERVEATDINLEQLKNSYKAPNINYSVSAAEQTHFPDDTFDIVTVALAAHWFDLDKFYAEVRRVLKPEGVLAIWGYSALDAVFPSDIAEVLQQTIYSAIEPHWPEKVRAIIRDSSSIKFPFAVLDAPQFYVRADFSLDEWLGLVSTWTAYRLYETEHGAGLFDRARELLRPIWPSRMRIEIPIMLKAARF